MAKHTEKKGLEAVIDAKGVQAIISALNKKNYKTIGPKLENGAVVYDNIRSVDDMPVGYRDVHGPGTYGIKRTGKNYLFDYVVGPQSWKKYLHQPEEILFKAEKVNGELKISDEGKKVPKYAFIGVRPCEIRAIQIQDNVFKNEEHYDRLYFEKRKSIFVVAVNCTRPGENCFCGCLNTGPKASSGFDIALTEVINKNGHYFLVEKGSNKGAKLLDTIRKRKAKEEEKREVQNLLRKAAKKMSVRLDPSKLHEIFYEHFDNPIWEKITERCLTCGNCTMVCPTCFCTTTIEKNYLDGKHAERWRVWDSCFSKDFSYIHGGSIRFSEKSRYRQWLTHKLITWMDQFGTVGCVGCGRCITWCPAGIDLTAEASAIMNKNL